MNGFNRKSIAFNNIIIDKQREREREINLIYDFNYKIEEKVIYSKTRYAV